MTRAAAPAKLNLALVVGPLGDDGKHEVTTVLLRLDLSDMLTLTEADTLRISGYEEDTIVRCALTALAGSARVEPRWAVRIWKRIPVAGGLGGGSSDAASALRLANATLARPLPDDELASLAAGIGADVPFFLAAGPQLGTGDGSILEPLALPTGYTVLLLLAEGAEKLSTASVYARFDERAGASGYEDRRAGLLAALARIRGPRDLAALPPNDLASSPLCAELRELGAFRADVSGAGPVVYGLFEERAVALAARRSFRGRCRSWLTTPAW